MPGILWKEDDGWRSRMRSHRSAHGPGVVTISSGQIAAPCTSTWSGASSPLPVGSEKSSATRWSRRMLKAFCGRPIEVLI